MAKKLINWRTKGMNRDTSPSAFSPEFAFENRNVRLSTNEGNTQMSWVNEKGTKKIKLGYDTGKKDINNNSIYKELFLNNGIPVGNAIINHKLVIFTAKDLNDEDFIYVFERAKNNPDYDLIGKVLFEGDLNLDPKYPLETLVSYESALVQKVYWTDNNNQLRVINIASSKEYVDKNQFNFIPELQLKEEVEVEKIYGSGEFPSGVIQYAFTYYNKYMQESSIFYVTPLQYISYFDRGGSPEDKIANSFKITISGVDTNFEYLRIYSILRTSKDAVPLVKRIQDIKIEGKTVSYIDTGYSGETIDPTELLYKGGEEIIAKTIEQKDSTLFLGNIQSSNKSIPSDIKKAIEYNFNNNVQPIKLSTVRSTIKGQSVDSSNLLYINTININGFKSREYYRVGLQFQYKTGKWSEPIHIDDYQIELAPNINEKNNIVEIPQIQAIISNTLKVNIEGESKTLKDALQSLGYKKVRLVIAQPFQADRTIICQGIANPCIYQRYKRYIEDKDYNIDTSKEGTLYGQSSWIFRPYKKLNLNTSSASNTGGGYITSTGKIPDLDNMEIAFDSNKVATISPLLNSLEIGTTCNKGNIAGRQFEVDSNLLTLHSPEFIFNEDLYSMDWTNMQIESIGSAHFNITYGDIDIQTSSPTIGATAGFIHKSIKTSGDAALVSGLFYEDYLVDDESTNPVTYSKCHEMKTYIQYPVYLWHHNGSLNNDVVREGRSASLLKKKVSNYHMSNSISWYPKETQDNTSVIKKLESKGLVFFHSDELSFEKINGHVYMGNIDTMIKPFKATPKYFAGDPFRDADVSVGDVCNYRLGRQNDEDATSKVGIWKADPTMIGNHGVAFWKKYNTDLIGDKVTDLCETSEPVRIKYKSTPHIVTLLEDNGDTLFSEAGESSLPILEVVKDYNSDTLYGGHSIDALKENIWIPVSNPKSLSEDTIVITSEWGDTWYQRFECLKTYPFTSEDVNQVIDIASFMVETHINIDGRYDRNRGQASNLNVSPTNFNLLNPVYSQLNNFFNYKILDDDDYKDKDYPNIVTWTKTKQNGADVDLWTNITLASTLELDGSNGKINKLIKLNNQLICFQDSGISQILYNENTQISSTEGVPIEIANSGKVQGKRYYSNTIGCSNKWSIVQTPSGIYFISNNDKGIYLFNGELKNLTVATGFNTWAKQNIPPVSVEWDPKDFENYISQYDTPNQEILFINKETALVYSEKFGCFTSFYNYENTPYLCNLDDFSLWIKKGYREIDVIDIWKHQAGKYCNFFGVNKGYSMTLIGNQEPTTDKIFTNLEFRAYIEGEGTYDKEKDKFSPTLPFDYLEVWDEYQHGILNLSDRNGHDRFTHGNADGNASLNRKFRMWRCDIPRDNAPIDDVTESKMGIKRFKVRPLDRIRNPWVYLKLEKKAAKEDGFLSKVEIHDIIGTYFS